MLISLGLDHRRADVATRERFHVAEDGVARMYAAPREGLQELTLVATCNRVELYGWAGLRRPEAARDLLPALAECWTGDTRLADELLTQATPRVGEAAARHLMRIAAGLESQVLGDAQILGQVRLAWRQAQEAGAAGPGLHRLFEGAIHAGKRVRSQTRIGTGPSSIGAQAAALAAHWCSPVRSCRRVVVVGCGQTGSRTARQLVKLGVTDLVLINRSPERARELAGELGVRSAPIEWLHPEAALADVVILATGAETPLLHAGGLSAARAAAAADDRPLRLVDLCVPRNVEAGVADLPNVSVVDLDALVPAIESAQAARHAAVPIAEAIVEEEVARFADWTAASGAREAVEPLRGALLRIAHREIAHAAGEVIADRVADRIVAKLMAGPMAALRTAVANHEPLDDVAATLRRLFP